MAGKFYAVRKGNKEGIYLSWEECRRMVDGCSGAQYKSFQTRAEAEEYLHGASQSPVPLDGAYAFVDGSYNVATKVYGYGGFLVYDGKKEVLQGAGADADMAQMRNVAGEILGSMAAIQKALELELKELIIYYDYMGIEMWASGSWKRNKSGTIAYYDYIQSVKDKIRIHFVKVKGHSGVEGNEEADRLAKEAAGVV